MEFTNMDLLDEFLTFDEWLEGDDPVLMAPAYPYNSPYPSIEIDAPAARTSTSALHEVPSHASEGKEKKDVRERFAFKTKSEVEIMDDGFKWRKYGKKMVKNSPNPRNYYKCAVEGCSVKKRVERDREDPRYVITTYEGIHNHLGS